MCGMGSKGRIWAERRFSQQCAAEKLSFSHRSLCFRHFCKIPLLKLFPISSLIHSLYHFIWLIVEHRRQISFAQFYWRHTLNCRQSPAQPVITLIITPLLLSSTSLPQTPIIGPVCTPQSVSLLNPFAHWSAVIFAGWIWLSLLMDKL